MECIASHPLINLFLLSFLAATLLPLGSEWYLVLLIHKGAAPIEAVSVATLGNYLGACTSYFVGVWGSSFFTHRLLRIQQRDLNRAQSIYARFGSWSLLLSWLPIIGDPLCVIGGVFRVHFLHYSVLVFSGKLARYVTIAYFSHSVLNQL